jgi:vesicle-fusing ATPase
MLLIFIDDIERIIEYVPIGLLQTLLVLLKKVPPDQGHRLLVIGTTSCPRFLEELGLMQAFSLTQSVLLFEEPSQITEVLRMAGHMNEYDATSIARAMTKPIGMKQLLMVAEMARQGSDGVTVDTNVFMERLHTVGY